MRRFRLSPEAAHDIRDIWSYIAMDSVRAARKVRLQILDACRRLAENPGIGHARSEPGRAILARGVVFNYLRSR